MFKRLLSYFLPVKIHHQKSEISSSLEVTWNYGELVLDSKNTNYSYGSLQRILRKGLLRIGTDNILAMNHVLVLGVAGGSVVRTLVDELKFSGRITGVEIDPEVVALSNKFFGLDKIANFEIIIDDAFEFVLKTRDKYDLIIVDIFQDTTMPNFLFEKFFTDRLAFLLKPKGYILFNTMTLTDLHEQRNRQYHADFSANEFTVTTIPRVENHNELILIQKMS